VERLCTEESIESKLSVGSRVSEEEEEGLDPSFPIAEVTKENLTTENVIRDQPIVTITVAKSNLNSF
jgi:hypothetical protein